MKYTDDVNAQIVLALLKKFCIRKIVVSPGTTNVPIARSVQFDPFFEVYSMVDERGAAYFAGGLAHASGEPVVISCTGATASRDYLPGLTEAYYRHLPVIALTSQHHSSTYHDLVPQMTDRTVSPNDIKKYSADLPCVRSQADYKACVRLVNEALIAATTGGGGPVHINLPVDPAYSFTTSELPDVVKIDVYNRENLPAEKLHQQLKKKKVAVFIGAHRRMSERETRAISRFAKAYDAVVLYDHTSSYCGENGMLISHAFLMLGKHQLPDLIIDMGSICGDYNGGKVFAGRTVWRLSEDGAILNRNDQVKLEAVFDCSETCFFETMAAYTGEQQYYSTLDTEAEKCYPSLPFSNLYICSQLAKKLPPKSYLHLAILNSLRSMDYFRLDSSIITSSNVGGFGIDGALSTLLGQSVADDSRLAFCLTGDLAFFYDMNTLGNRHVHNRLRIMLVNNGRGVEFRLNKRLENQWGADSDALIAAKGHFGSAKGWAESMGFHYMTASNAASFDAQVAEFCHQDLEHFKKPVLFEVFTEVENEKNALQAILDSSPHAIKIKWLKEEHPVGRALRRAKRLVIRVINKGKKTLGMIQKKLKQR